MPFIKKFRTDFFLENKQIQLSNDYLKTARLKKITGTRLGSVLGKDAYKSPLKAWAIMTGIYEEVIDPIFATAGKVLEKKLLSHVNEKMGINYHNYDPYQYGWDLFADNKYFGGIPDAEASNAPMLEIKTTSIDDFALVYDKQIRGFLVKKDDNGIPIVKNPKGKYKKWFIDNKVVIPINYKMQLGLYLYLRNQLEGMFIICFLQKEDYAYPEKCDVKKREIIFEKMKINLNLFRKYLLTAEEWYEKHVLTGVSPQMTDEEINWLLKEVDQL